MNVVTLTPDSLDDAVGLHPVLVVEFADPIASSSLLAPLAQAHAGVAFGRVTAEASPRLGAMFGLPPGPGLVIFRERIVLYCEPGAHTGDRVENLLAQIRSLDMEVVRAAIEEEKRAAMALQMRRVCPATRRSQLPEG